MTAYRDPGGVVTICNGITGPDIKMGMTVTKEWCDNRFAAELEKHSKPLDKVPYQMSVRARVAWADFLFNLGTGVATDKSTPWRKLMAGDWSGSCDAFLMYRYTRVDGVKKDCSIAASKCTGIWTRRNAERDRGKAKRRGDEDEPFAALRKHIAFEDGAFVRTQDHKASSRCGVWEMTRITSL